ncbi:hypothetical protein EVAR_34699_1 [Eumeta japonica]|uniref:Uncharacterized protein n=1 Tax=Eumeta variegata TaxID=151549 RepID=A0A4C1XG84_EUMVA|nr:hypothetical protein EVAR_34699_1 [Eumeta japonica]
MFLRPSSPPLTRFPIPDANLPIGRASNWADKAFQDSSRGVSLDRSSGVSLLDPIKDGRPILFLRLARLSKPRTSSSAVNTPTSDSLAAAAAASANPTSTTNLGGAGGAPAVTVPSSNVTICALFICWLGFTLSYFSRAYWGRGACWGQMLMIDNKLSVRQSCVEPHRRRPTTPEGGFRKLRDRRYVYCQPGTSSGNYSPPHPPEGKKYSKQLTNPDKTSLSGTLSCNACLPVTVRNFLRMCLVGMKCT